MATKPTAKKAAKPVAKPAKRAAAKPAPAAPPRRAKAAPVPSPTPAPIAAPVAPPKPQPAPVVRHSVPLGVYLNENRNTAIVIKHTATGVWYLTMLTGEITLEHASNDKFNYEWRLPLPHYPLRRAIRLYNEAPQMRDDQCKKVMRVLLRDL